MMPFSEFHSSVKGKHEPTRPKMANCSSDLSSFVPDQEFVELLWENGQIVMQGQSNRSKRSLYPGALPSCAGKDQEKEGEDAVAPKAGRYGAMDSAGKDVQLTGPLGQIGLNGQDVDVVPWSNYPIDDYCTEFFSEFSGVNLNSSSTAVAADRISSYNQATKGVHVQEKGNGTRDLAGRSEPNGMMNSQLCQLPQQCQSFIPRTRQKETDITTGMVQPGHTGHLQDTRVQKQDLTSSNLMQLNNNTGLANFSHFSRPVALVKANLQCFDRAMNEKRSTTMCSNPMESTLTEPMSTLKSVAGFHGQLTSVTAKADSKSSAQPLQVMVSVENSDAICKEDIAENSRSHKKINTTNNQRSPDHMKRHSLSFMDSAAVVKCEAHKRTEPVVASPSMCSANGVAAASSLVRNRGKRKSQECEESEYHSEDFEDDSFDAKKTVPGRGMSAKRSRAAEVHNLSERRRRDRINEKMRALQELIPNCNKVDKASVLDEAIEYLKSLQMQVQIMSMGGGLCMPPMMLPPGVRAMQMGPFAPMGMGMGLGFGMGMLDMTGSPMIPINPLHRPQYSCPAIAGATGLRGMPMSSNLHMFGIPVQTSPMPMPRPPPYFPLTAMSMNVNPSAEVPKAEVCPVQVTDSAPQNSNNQQMQTLDPVAKTSIDNSQASRINEQSCMVGLDNQTSNVCGNEAINSKDVVSSSSMTSACNGAG